MADIEPLQGFTVTDKETPLAESVKDLSGQQLFNMDFCDCQLEAWRLGALQVVC